MSNKLNSSRASSVVASKKETPKNNGNKKPPVPGHRTLEQFYSGKKEARGVMNNLFSPVLSNMHKLEHRRS
jgi:hypothetical protein